MDLPGVRHQEAHDDVSNSVPLSGCPYLIDDKGRYFRLRLSDSPRLVVFGYPLEKSSGKAITASTFPEIIHDFAYVWNHSASAVEFEGTSQTGFFVNGEPRPSYFAESNSYSGKFTCTTKAHGEAADLTLDGWATKKTQLFILMRSPLGTIFALELTRGWVTVSPAEGLRKALSNGSILGDFQTAFPDLALAVGNNEYQTWDDLRKLLADQTGRGDSFEAFGLKFPASQITVWGMLVILFVQLYFAVYLIQLSQKELTLENPGAEVPWVGINMSFAGRALYFATALALPVVTVVLLVARAGVRALGRATKLTLEFWAWDWGRLSLVPTLQAGLLLAGLLLAIVLAYACWRNRPCLKPEKSEENPEPTVSSHRVDPSCGST